MYIHIHVSTYLHMDKHVHITAPICLYTRVHIYLHSRIKQACVPACVHAGAHICTHPCAWQHMVSRGTPCSPQLPEGRPGLCPRARGDQRVQHPATAAHQSGEARVSQRGESCQGCHPTMDSAGLRVLKCREVWRAVGTVGGTWEVSIPRWPILMRREKAEPGFQPHPSHSSFDPLFPHLSHGHTEN